jgi:hypothetical protein
MKNEQKRTACAKSELCEGMGKMAEITKKKVET